MYEEIVVMPTGEPDATLSSIITEFYRRLAMSEMETNSDANLGVNPVPV